MLKVIKPDYSIIKKIDIWREYTEEEISSLYNYVNHFDTPEHKKLIIEKSKISALGNPYILRNKKNIKDDELHSTRIYAERNCFDNDHKEAIIRQRSGEITESELDRITFTSWFKKEIKRLRSEEPGI